MLKNECPKCNFEWNFSSSDCPRCGIVLSKVTDKSLKPQDQVLGPIELVAQWQDLLKAYDSEILHDQFIQRSLALKKLNFASQQYRKMLEINPHDETAKAMQENIIQLASYQVISRPHRSTKFSKWLSVFVFFSSMSLFIGLILEKSVFKWIGISGLVCSFLYFYVRSSRIKE